MPAFRFHALTIGNAIVDILARTDEAFLAKEGLTKGMMRLIDAEEATRLYSHMGPAIETSGGSAANTAAGIASFGGKAAYFGKVAADQLGDVFTHDIQAIGAHFGTKPLIEGAPTARSMILITPDGERTMNTYLGACHFLTPDDVEQDVVEAAAVTYMEGYLWDPETAKQAFLKSAEIAHAARRKVAISLSDSFCVDRYRAEFLQLLRSGTVDILLANESEIKALYETSDLATAVESVREDAWLSAITIGEDGALVVAKTQDIHVPSYPIERLDDLTGAGDQFAAGFLYGFTEGMALDVAARLGCLAASEVIQHIGPRPSESLKALAQEYGIVG